MRFYRAFTLAELMIVLSVIGVLAAVLLPAARNGMPNEDVMKFQKANSTLTTTVRELVNTDKYYHDGDLGTRFDKTAPNSAYFCNTFADIVTTKSVDCSGSYSASGCTYVNASSGLTSTVKDKFDSCCATAQANTARVVSSDNVTWFEASQTTTFASVSGGKRIFAPPKAEDVQFKDGNGFDSAYKVYCFDIDGISSGEAPFGYGIRADGRVVHGTRAEAWTNRSIQDND
ncbi:MAG: type II secretion system protein [Candidatus Gastranaerophilales bacterium]|nr:type II secretion system protein [Candidatus Gastranaerophilales bacterium]